MMTNSTRAGTLLLACLLVAGCVAIGPGSVTRDRFDYNAAIADSAKEQTLLNIVKLRYADVPLFLEVESIVSGYTLETSVSLLGKAFERGASPAELSLGGSGHYTDRPTITYAPLRGKEFNRNFLTPVPPNALLFMLQAGWPAELILPLTLDTINGIRAPIAAGVSQRRASEDYFRMIELVSTIQRAGGIGMRVIPDDEGSGALLLVVPNKDLPPAVKSAQLELAALLGIDPGREEYRVVFGELPHDKGEIAMVTRSIMGLMVALANEVNVPEAHVFEGRAQASTALDAQAGAASPGQDLVDIYHSTERPADAFVAAKYRDLWFWIDDRDYRSKRTFAYLLILISLTETGARDALPLVTIPAG